MEKAINYNDVLNLSYFTSGKVNEDQKKYTDSKIKNEETEKPKRSKKKKDQAIATVMTDDNLSMTDSNTPYSSTYEETNNMLKATIAQTDMLNSQIQEDLTAVRASKTMRSKYTYLSNLIGSSATLIGAKIQAIREIDNNITQGHNLDLKRAKDLKAGVDEKNDDMNIMRMYDAFVNIPIGTYNPNPAPSLQNLTTAIDSSSGITGVSMDNQNVDSGYDEYLANLSPASNRARIEGDSNIATVVVYNTDTGSKYFDIIDLRTNTSIPNIEKPGDFLLADTDIDFHNNIARNRNADMTWPLIVTGNADISEY